MWLDFACLVSLCPVELNAAKGTACSAPTGDVFLFLYSDEPEAHGECDRQSPPWAKKSYTNNHLRFTLHARRSFLVSLVKRRCDGIA